MKELSEPNLIISSDSPESYPRGSKLPRKNLVAHSTLSFPLTAANAPIAVYLPAIYSQQYGLPLALVGIIFLFERLWGTLADPLVGILSDKTQIRFGRRKTWIAVGGILYALSAMFLFFPNKDVTAIHLTASLFLFYFSWSMVQIPYLAWSGELTDDYHERTRIATFQMVGGAISMFVVLLVPSITDQLWPNDPEMKLKAMGAVIVAPLAPALVMTLLAFPDRAAAPSPTGSRVWFWETIRVVLHEPGLVRILIADLVMTFAQGCRGALFVFFVSDYAGLPRWASALFLVQFVFGIAAAPIWAAIARRYGKGHTAFIGELLQVAINLALLLIAKGELVPLLALTIAQGLTQSSGNLMLRSMLADVAERHRRTVGIDRTGLLFSVFSISAKIGIAAPIGIALPLLAWLGFNPAAHSNRPEALTAVALIFALGPALAHLLSAILIRGFSVQESRQASQPELEATSTAYPTTIS